MTKRPPDTSAEEPDGGNPHIRFRGGPRLGDRPGLLNIGRSLRFRVLIDGSAPGPSHGTDVDEHGIGMLSDHRLYQLIRQTGTIEDHVFEIEFLDSGAEAYSFTFG
jgi:hypothetical protein